MNRRRVALGVVGLLCLALGLFANSGEGVVADATAALGSDYALVAGLAGVTLVASLPVLVSSREGALEQSTTPDPEQPVDRPAAGHDFDETIHGWRFRLPLVGDRRRAETRQRLREAAVGAVMRAEDCDRDAAKRLVERGAWTDDPAAARFLDPGVAAGGTLATWADAVTRFETPTERRARVTAEAIAATERDGVPDAHPSDETGGAR